MKKKLFTLKPGRPQKECRQKTSFTEMLEQVGKIPPVAKKIAHAMKKGFLKGYPSIHHFAS